MGAVEEGAEAKYILSGFVAEIPILKILLFPYGPYAFHVIPLSSLRDK